MIIEEIKGFWGDQLVALPASMIDPLPLDEATKTFLKTIGLPRQINVFPDEDLAFVMNTDTLFETENGPVRIGQMGEEEMYLILAPDGAVFVVSEDAQQFVNSSLQQFLSFVVLYKRLYSVFWLSSGIDWDALDADTREETAADIAIRFKAEFEPHDQQSFAHDETWWSRAIEEMEYGLW